MLTKREVDEIKEELETASNPVYFFHDDPDGLCSFLLLYRFVREGHGIIVKTKPSVDERFLRKVEEYKPDKIFIVDLAMVEQDFIDRAKTKIIWIDHHEPLKRHGVKYYNPRVKHPKTNIPASFLCHQAVARDLWIAMVGCVGDWYFPKFADEFKKKYPKLLAKPIKDPEVALYTSRLGELIRIFSFILKGKTSDVMKCVKILTRIKEPDDILEQKTAAGRFIYKKFAKTNKDYQELYKRAEREKQITNKMMIFTYTHKTMSFTSDLSNEMLHRYPQKVILIAREKSGEMRMSLRSKGIKLPAILKKALEGVEGYGGGHEYACGANVKKRDFDVFVQNLEKQL
jgi:single-stranded DNA-specific DHH superfamily exonuclease